MEALFDNIQVINTSAFSYEIQPNDPSLLGLVAMGTNSFPLLIAKLEQKTSDQKDASPLYRLGEMYDLLAKPREYHAWHEQVRVQKVTTILRRIGPETDALVPYLLERALHTNSWDQMSAAWALRDISRRPEKVIPAMIPLLSEGEPGFAASWCIASFSNHTGISVPLLVKATETTNYVQSWHAIKTLERIGATDALIPIAGSMITDAQNPYRLEVAVILSQYGTNAQTAAPTLFQLAHTLTNQVDSNCVLEIIRKIDPEGVYAKP